MTSEFDRLPTELIISIFDKIFDVRSLFSCYSFSKQFAALVPQTRFVFVRIRSAFAQSSRDVVWPHGILNFLKKLSCVEHATIQFSPRDPNPSRSDSEPLFRWKSDSSGFIFVFADDKEAADGFPLNKRGSALFARMEYQLFDCMSRVLYMEALVAAVFPNLKDVSAVDSTGRGRVVLDVSEIRKEKRVGFTTFFSVRRWSACLPFYGCAMKDVTVLTVREIKDRNVLFEENPFEEKEYCEVANSMMKDYLCFEALISALIRVPFAHLAWDALVNERIGRSFGLNVAFTGYSLKRDRLSPLELETLMDYNCNNYVRSKFV